VLCKVTNSSKTTVIHRESCGAALVWVEHLYQGCSAGREEALRLQCQRLSVGEQGRSAALRAEVVSLTYQAYLTTVL
jgi:hypothetical protein